MNETDPDYCWSHHVVEIPGYFRCGECFHWFISPAALVEEFADKMVEVGSHPLRTAEEIFFCPHCAHDF